MRSRHSHVTRASPTTLVVSGEVAKQASLPRARRAALVVISLCDMKCHCTDVRPLSFGARMWRDVRAAAFNAHSAFAWHARKPTALAVSPEVEKYASLLLRAPCRAGSDQSTRHERALHRQEASFLRCKTVVRRASCGLQHTAGVRVTDAQAPLRWLSLGRWRNRRACRAGQPCRAGCDRPTHHERALHRREASLLRCMTVVRRASCGLQRAAGIRMARAQAALRWLSLGRW